MRILALDHGTVRIGVALSDELKMIAHPLEVIPIFRRIPGSFGRDFAYTFIWNGFFALAFYAINAMAAGLSFHARNQAPASVPAAARVCIASTVSCGFRSISK